MDWWIGGLADEWMDGLVDFGELGGRMECWNVGMAGQQKTLPPAIASGNACKELRETIERVSA